VRYLPRKIAPGALAGIRAIVPSCFKRFSSTAPKAKAFYQKPRARHSAHLAAHGDAVIPLRGAPPKRLVVDERRRGSRGIVNLGLHSSCTRIRVRSANLDHPDELRVDLDPGPGVRMGGRAQGSATEVQALLEELAFAAGPKTSGSRGCTSMCESSRGWTFQRSAGGAALCALACGGAGAWPALATSKWWKGGAPRAWFPRLQPERQRNRTTCSAYSGSAAA